MDSVGTAEQPPERSIDKGRSVAGNESEYGIVNGMVGDTGENAACSDGDETENTADEKGDDALLENRMGHSKQDARQDDRFEVAADGLHSGKNKSSEGEFFDDGRRNGDHGDDGPNTG